MTNGEAPRGRLDGRSVDAERISVEPSDAVEALAATLAERLSEAEAQSAFESQRADVAEEALASIRRSRAFRLISIYYRMVDRVAPVGTRRRRAYSVTMRSLVDLGRRLRPLPAVPSAKIRIRTSEQPEVSIIIPVHGKWEYTARCLQSVADTTGDIPFEVVVVDDASPDDTIERLRKVRGVRVVHLDHNVGFVGACNAGIEAARGEYVVLLNNDTRVEPGWLVPLVETVSEPGVGLVGSRLQYPDGRLQEAGGIIFSDGSGWNYGKFDDPESPAYAYRRDVDYCSGASIIVRKTVLDELGNLDTRFAPAYYEDTDLAFGVRELGLRVVYEPRSIVIHDEGISHGTDESAGVKAYQAINKVKFVEKWRARLDEQCEPGAASVPFAVRRRNGERIVVVIDHYVPRPDEDSGSVRMMGILCTLRELGYSVIFVPDNRIRTEPWTRALGDLGIEVFYGHGKLQEHLRSLADHIDAVVVSRMSVALSHVVSIRSTLPDVPLIFDTVDLHFLREERAAELAGTPELVARARTVRLLELALVESADTTLVVSPYEQQLLAGLLPHAPVKVLPNVHRPEAFPATTRGRSGLLFVGSFAHQPNADGLRWFFSDVLPMIEDGLPGVRVSVVGRDPDPELVASAPDNVLFHGWVDDLTPLYDGARVALAPLRYGAGVKGKIGEAMAHGVPVVMTPIGAEGMSIAHGETAWVAHDAASFAAGVIQLMSDDELWQRLSKAGAEHIDAIFGPERFAELLRGILP